MCLLNKTQTLKDGEGIPFVDKRVNEVDLQLIAVFRLENSSQTKPTKLGRIELTGKSQGQCGQAKSDLLFKLGKGDV